MPLNPGTKFGPYEIQAPLGAGGMGEVYRATDTRLNRTVAIKILPKHLSEKPEARERFEREARAISQLSHANICQLYDLGEQDGIHYIVMEYLEGETLAARLARGRLPIELVLRYGAEIGEGLDSAHRAGVVHRDLKPGNIMITRSGAKLMDFGLAKTATLASQQSSGLSLTLTSPNISQPLTTEGTVIGTFQYMSPEQVEGREADARSDIFSFGSVLYEMTTGKRAFEGKSQVTVASAILEKEPDPVTVSQPLAPPALQHVIQTALMKDPESRWQSAADISRQLRWMSSPDSSASAARIATPHPHRQERILWALLAVALAGLLLWFGYLNRPHPRVVRASIMAPPGTGFDFMGDFSGPPVVSLDGTRIAFAAHGANERNTIWIRRLDMTTAERLGGTEGAYGQFWSPDGKWLGFFADGKLRKVSSSGGPVTILADAPNARGGAWSPNDVIVYAPDYRDSLWKINASGGDAVRATQLDPAKHSTHRWPTFLPDGKHFLFLATNHSGGRREDNGVYMGSVDSMASNLVLVSDAQALSSSGYLLYHQQNVLMAQKFDPARGTLSGEAMSIASDVQYDGGTFRTVFSVAQSGALVYEPGANSVGDKLALWMNRDGKVLGPVAEPGAYKGGVLSPDGKRLAMGIGEPRADIWILDLQHGSRMRLTFDDALHQMPAWSADGKRIAYVSQKGAFIMAGTSLHAKPADGSGQDEMLLDSKDLSTGQVSVTWPQWTPDNRYLIYKLQSGPSGASIWALPNAPGAKPQPVVKPESPIGTVVYLRISPDGRWLAYSFNDGNREEIYVTSFPSGEGRWQVSRAGGTYPVWRHDGKEIFYISLDGHLNATQVEPRENSFDVGKTDVLFEMRYTNPLGTPFDVAPDGRFMVLSQPEGSGQPMALVLNWNADLK
jgi:Tol biopolymer transport system component/tRNA A-37 threonylcarbamoyl transferase component Bud32